MDVDLIKKVPIPSNLLRRVGRFSIRSAILKSDPDAFLILSAQIIVVRCEHLFHSESFEYVALSPLFDERDPGSMIPNYRIQINLDTREVTAFRIGSLEDSVDARVIIDNKRHIDL
jgi:hypothetical protein